MRQHRAPEGHPAHQVSKQPGCPQPPSLPPCWAPSLLVRLCFEVSFRCDGLQGLLMLPTLVLSECVLGPHAVSGTCPGKLALMRRRGWRKLCLPKLSFLPQLCPRKYGLSRIWIALAANKLALPFLRRHDLPALVGFTHERYIHNRITQKLKQTVRGQSTPVCSGKHRENHLTLKKAISRFRGPTVGGRQNQTLHGRNIPPTPQSSMLVKLWTVIGRVDNKIKPRE